MPPKPPAIPFRKSEDYLTARAANPTTGLISPSQYSPGLGSPTPRTPATPGEALTLYNVVEEDTLPGSTETLSIEQHNRVLRQAKRPGLRRLMAGLGKRGSATSGELGVLGQGTLGHEVAEGTSCSSDDELFFANPPQEYQQPTHHLNQGPALSRMKTVWRDVSTAWQERRAVASATTAHAWNEARAFDASTELAQMECAQQEVMAVKAPRKLAGATVQLSGTKTMTMSDTWSIVPGTGHGDEETSEPKAEDQTEDHPRRRGAKGNVDLRKLPPVVLRRPSQAANKRSSPQRVACGRKIEPTTKPWRSTPREDPAASAARPDGGSTVFESVLTIILKASSIIIRSLNLSDLGEALPVLLDAQETAGEVRLRASFALMRTAIQLLLVVYALANVFATGRWLCSIFQPVLWPLVMIFKIAKWIITS